MRLTPKERAQDEQILAVIIAAAESTGRQVRPHFDHDAVQGSSNGFGVWSADPEDGPCCAVGVGVLYAGLDRVDDAINSFAKAYRVSAEYAMGVSCGFEFAIERDELLRLKQVSNPRLYLYSRDCRRGFLVGKAAFEALFKSEEPSVTAADSATV